MGFYDHITVNAANAVSGIDAGTRFQTKNLHNCDGEFTIMAAGQLVEHVYRFKEHRNGALLGRPVNVEDKVLAFHGDLLLRAEKLSRELVARFTHGQLEWIRDSADYPEGNLALLLEQGAR